MSSIGHMKPIASSFFALVVTLLATTNAHAQNASAPAVNAPTTAAHEDGVRFRGGISVGAGGYFGSYETGNADFSATLVGVDGRLGVQINDLIGIYAQPHLSFGTGKDGAATGFTGLFATSVIADFTFFDRIFVGAGGGFGIVNNPSGPELHLRAGAYPLMDHTGKRRKGLVLAADLRVILLDAPYSSAVMPFVSIGYEAF